MWEHWLVGWGEDKGPRSQVWTFQYPWGGWVSLREGIRAVDLERRLRAGGQSGAGDRRGEGAGFEGQKSGGGEWFGDLGKIHCRSQNLTLIQPLGHCPSL